MLRLEGYVNYRHTVKMMAGKEARYMQLINVEFTPKKTLQEIRKITS